MSREIKFRVISNEKIAGYERLTDKGWEWNWIELNPDKGERWINGVIEGLSEGIIRNQYTGLKDKNGKKIYEGDVVKVKGTKRVGDYVTVIIYRGLGFTLKENRTYWNDFMIPRMAIEVIGNIYENPELLEP